MHGSLTHAGAPRVFGFLARSAFWKRHSIRKSDAFTLIELLVVIGIISVLISILVPALSKARNQATGLVCINNLQQIGRMINIYVSDHKGVFPPYAISGVQGWQGILIERTYRNCSPGEQLARYWNAGYTSYKNDMAFPVFFCPVMAELGYRGNSMPITGYYTNYAINFTLFSEAPSPPVSDGIWRPISKVRKPSDSGVIWDSIGYQGGPPRRSVGATVTYQIQSGNPNNSVGYPHGQRQTQGTLNGLYGGNTNVLFVDGHVSGIRDPGRTKDLPIAVKEYNQLWW